VGHETFDQRVFDRLKAAAHEAAADAPELEAVAVVCLWRFRDQSSLPSKMLVGGDGPVVNPDALLRLSIEASALSRFLLDKAVEGTHAIREMASQLAREINEQAAQALQEAAQAAPADAGAAADQPRRDLDGRA
jgi:hypothetical protein